MRTTIATFLAALLLCSVAQAGLNDPWFKGTTGAGTETTQVKSGEIVSFPIPSGASPTYSQAMKCNSDSGCTIMVDIQVGVLYGSKANAALNSVVLHSPDNVAYAYTAVPVHAGGLTTGILDASNLVIYQLPSHHYFWINLTNSSAIARVYMIGN